MMRAFLTLCTFFLGANLVLAQDMAPVKLSLTANPCAGAGAALCSAAGAAWPDAG